MRNVKNNVGAFGVWLIIVLCVIISLVELTDIITASSMVGNSDGYGVFIGADNSDLSEFDGYSSIVIDAQYFTTKDIKKLHKSGISVYSYINAGSLENFRSYYDDYERYCLDTYEGWEDEKWVDVSSSKWQSFITDTLASSLAQKDIDGFFVDNCDVYYHYPTEDIYDGLCNILKSLKGYGLEVIINGGDTFVDAYYDENGSVSEILDSINQEDVFTSFDYETANFTKAKKADRLYYQSYIEKYSGLGVKIYMTEYTHNSSLKRKIKKYAKKHGFSYYISDSIELT